MRSAYCALRLLPMGRFHAARDKSYSGLGSCAIQTAHPEEQTFSHCVRKGNITQAV
jgi:hypothetical protein